MARPEFDESAPDDGSGDMPAETNVGMLHNGPIPGVVNRGVSK